MRELHRGRVLQRPEMRTTLHESLSRIQFGESSEQIFCIATCVHLAQLDLLIHLRFFIISCRAALLSFIRAVDLNFIAFYEFSNYLSLFQQDWFQSKRNNLIYLTFMNSSSNFFNCKKYKWLLNHFEGLTRLLYQIDENVR